MSKRIAASPCSIRIHDDGRVTGYLVRFTGKDECDLYDTYFNENTDFILDAFPVAGYNVLYDHALDDGMGIRTLGTFTRAELRTEPDENGDYGLWVEAQLKKMDEYVQMLRELDQRARKKYNRGLGFSSGALPQSVRVNPETGHVERWAIIEGSLTLTPADTKNQASIRSLIDLQAELLGEPDAKEADATQDKRQIISQQKGTRSMEMLMERLMAVIQEYLDEMSNMDETDPERMNDEEDMRMDEEEDVRMDEEEVRAFAAELAKRVKPTLDALTNGGQPDEAAIQRALKAHGESLFEATAERVFKVQAEKRAKRRAVIRAARGKFAVAPGKSDIAGGHNGNHNPTRSNVNVSENLSYAHLSAEEMTAGYLLIESQLPPAMRGRLPANQLVSDAYFRHMTQKVAARMKKGFSDIRDQSAVRAAVPFRADEINAADIAGQGQEWVGEFYGTTLWETARNETQVFSALNQRGMFNQEIPQGAGSVPVPTEESDPVAYSTPQANDLDATNRVEVTANISYFGTGNKTLTPGQIKIAAAATDELVEDSVIAILPNMQRQMQIKAIETLDQAILNGDTATGASTNINLIDATPGTGIDRPYYLAVNGLRKYPLVTNTDYARTAGASLALSDYRETLALFTSKVQTRLSQLLFLIDVYTHNASLALPEIATDDVRRTNATITSGRVLNIFGVDVLTTGFLEKANTAGKISNTGSNNIAGQILAVYAPYWAFGWKREIRLETERKIESGVTIAVASMRFGFVARGADASAVTYNVGLS